VTRGTISKETALGRSSRPAELLGLLQRAGVATSDDHNPAGLRLAGS
jgi:hypothetical protein